MKFFRILFSFIFLTVQSALAQHLDNQIVHIPFYDGIFKDLKNAGCDLDHLKYFPKKLIIASLTSNEISKIQDSKISFSIPTLQERENFRSRELGCKAFQQEYLTTPSRFRLGDMGGYFKYSDLLAILDSMQKAYPDLMTIPSPISSFKTIENHPILTFKITNIKKTNAKKPQILFTALHHAREPMGLSQLVMYMWYLLENYGQDDLVTQLVDFTEIHFVPCVNPDGYIYNEQILPTGGGNWRKNRKLVDPENGIYGVDLNRNYGYLWGLDDEGSSPINTSQTYRGDEPFSEIETQAIKYLVDSNEFSIAINYHTFGNSLIYPYGFTTDTCPDYDNFRTISQFFASSNNFIYGNSNETVGYSTNGTSDDWMYEGNLNKKIFALTPELGDPMEGFWPPQNKIIPTSTKMLQANLDMTLAVHSLIHLELEQFKIIGYQSTKINLKASKIGLLPGENIINLNIRNDKATLKENHFTLQLNHAEKKNLELNITPNPSLKNGDTIWLEIDKQMGLIFQTESIPILFYKTLVIDTNDCSSINSFNTEGKWGLTNEDFVTSSTSLTDSPYANYDSLTNKMVTTVEEYKIPLEGKTFLSFYAKWNIEAAFDYSQVFAIQGNETIPLCGKYSKLGNSLQDLDQPIYDGLQNQWVKEEIELDQFKGQIIQIGFKIVSDDIEQLDGMFIDDLSIIHFPKDGINTNTTNEQPLFASPNPAHDEISLYGYLPTNKASFQISNILGHTVLQGSLTKTINISKLKPGTYFIKLNENAQNYKPIKFIKI